MTTTVATPTTTIQQALDASLSRIRELNPDVPESLAVILASGGGKKHGHFAASTWTDSSGDHAGSARHEILMATESLRRGAEATLTTLIHECGHALAHATDVKDTSRGGRYHNAKFRDVATTMGLVVEEDPSIGHVTTGLMSWAKDSYAEVLEMLEASLTTYRKPEDKAKGPKTTIRVQCDCETPVTVPIKWWESFGEDMMYCAGCGNNFAEV